MSNKEKIQQKYDEDLEHLHSTLNTIINSKMLPEGETTGGGAGTNGYEGEDNKHYTVPFCDIEVKYRGLGYLITIDPFPSTYAGEDSDDDRIYEIGDII